MRYTYKVAKVAACDYADTYKAGYVYTRLNSINEAYALSNELNTIILHKGSERCSCRYEVQDINQ